MGAPTSIARDTGSGAGAFIPGQRSANVALMTNCRVVIVVLASVAGLGACKKDEKKAGDAPGTSAAKPKAGTAAAEPGTAAAEPGTAAAAPGTAAAPAGGAAGGCGSDWANPMKTYCVTVPAGYTPGEPTSTENFTAENIKFTGPDGSFEIYDDKGDAYDKTLASHDKEVKANPVKETGTTAGTGQWWYYTESEYPRMMSLIKANSGEPIWCHASGKPDDEGDGLPAAPMAACKSLRAYPQ